MEGKGDAYYVGQVLDGNVNALTVLVDRYKHMAYTLAYRVLNNAEDAEEVCQDAFLKAYKSLGNFRMHSKFSTWLYSIVYHTAISALRKRKHVLVSMEDMPEGVKKIGEDTQEEIPVSAEMLHSALQQIDETDRVLVSLYYLEDHDVKALSEITGLSVSNVKVRLFRARQKLHELLSKVVTEI